MYMQATELCAWAGLRQQRIETKTANERFFHARSQDGQTDLIESSLERKFKRPKPAFLEFRDRHLPIDGRLVDMADLRSRRLDLGG